MKINIYENRPKLQVCESGKKLQIPKRKALKENT